MYLVAFDCETGIVSEPVAEHLLPAGIAVSDGRRGLDLVGEKLLQRPCNVGMDARATAAQQRGISRVLHQRVFEDIGRLRRAPRAWISSAAMSWPSASCKTGPRIGETASSNRRENSRPIAAAICAVSRTGARRSRRAIRESCKVEGIASGVSAAQRI